MTKRKERLRERLELGGTTHQNSEDSKSEFPIFSTSFQAPLPVCFFSLGSSKPCSYDLPVPEQAPVR